jgi:predicted nuclease with RNAse H fold
VANGQPLPFAGVDLTAGKRVSDVAGLDLAGRRVAFATALTDDELARVLAELGAEVVAIDSPMGLPAGLCCLEESCACTPPNGAVGRSAERALIKRGIPCFWTTKRTIIKSMIHRAIALKARLESEGYTVLEVFPYAVKRILLGRKLPRKSQPAGIAHLVAGAHALLPECCWPDAWAPGHDQLDALYCAITARLFALGQTEALGDPAEVPIIVPLVKSSLCGQKPSGLTPRS